MTGNELPLRCQVGECGNRAALTVTVELPVEWSASRTYNVVTLQVAACGECARGLEEHGRLLLAARVQHGRLREAVEESDRARTQLVALVEAVGAPFEPVQGTTFGRWLAALDRGSAQSAWRLLSAVKRRALGSGRVRSNDPTTSSLPADREPGEAPAGPPLRLDGARIRHRVLVSPMEPVPPGPAGPPSDHRPRGGDDAA